uniref:Uncharacterized protein n=1 Tax=Sphaerodactylus townsendi TaxID=933632 RepID=A0ACB8FCV5_9SAUR
MRCKNWAALPSSVAVGQPSSPPWAEHHRPGSTWGCCCTSWSRGSLSKAILQRAARDPGSWSRCPTYIHRLSMGLLCHTRRSHKPLVPIGKATTLLLEILGLLCKGMSHKKAGSLWREGGRRWKGYLPEDQDVNKFITEQESGQVFSQLRRPTGDPFHLPSILSPSHSDHHKVEYTMGDSSDTPSRKELTSEDLCKQLDKLLKESADNQRIFDWVEANLSEQQVSSNMFMGP